MNHTRFLISRVDGSLECRLDAVAENQANFELSACEIIPELLLVNDGNLRFRFRLDQQDAVDNHICAVRAYDFALVIHRDWHLALDSVIPFPQLNAQGADTYLLTEAVPKFVVRIVEGTNYGTGRRLLQKNPDPWPFLCHQLDQCSAMPACAVHAGL